jgi:hypothetical protein
MQADVTEIGARLASDGYAVFRSQDEDLAAVSNLVAHFGRPIHVFTRFPFWKPIGVDVSRPRGKSEGIGFNGPHLDCVNMAEPPDLVCFVCLRPDPLGGGANFIVDTTGIDSQIPDDVRDALGEAAFSEGAAFDLENVGESMECFPVLSDERWPCRFSNRLLETTTDNKRHNALRILDEQLLHRIQLVPLGRCDVLLVNQRKALHGRLPLHGDQSLVPGDKRRLIVQSFYRFEDADSVK